MKNPSNPQIFLLTSMIVVGVVVLLSPQRSYGQKTPAFAIQLSSAVSMTLAQGPIQGNGIGIGQLDNYPCSLTGDPTANINLRCGDQYHPYAETAIAVDPNDPNHLLVGANDYHPVVLGQGRRYNPLIGFFVSFDGGLNWTGGELPGSGGGSVDPSPVFNAKYGTAHMGHLGFQCPLGQCTYNAEVSTSLDGGLSWEHSVVVANGKGSFSNSETTILNDKPWLVADNNPLSPFYGRLYLTWSRFLFPNYNFALESPIFLSYSDDDGKKWSSGVEISGSSSLYCTFSSSGFGNRCADDQFSTAVVLRDGTVVVHYLNADNTSAWEAPFEFELQTMVVRSTDGGATWSQPIHIADLENGGFSDYPLNIIDSPTQTGHQFVTWSVQEMTTDPVTGNLYVFLTDNRDGIHDSFTPVTQTNVFMTKSIDGGLTWQGPTRVTSGPGDRWMASGTAYNDEVRVVFLDGSYDYPNRTLYGVTLGASSDGGATWSFTRVDTAPSNPNNSFWFASGASGCRRCTYFIGDYQGMTMDSLGRAHIVWTDMRRDIGTPPTKAHDIEYARR